MTLDNGILLLYPSTYMYKQAHIYTCIYVHTHSYILWTYIVFKSTTIIHKVIEVFFLLIFEGRSSVNVTSLKRFRGYNRSKSGIFSYFLIHVCWFIPPRVINVQYDFTKVFHLNLLLPRSV